MKIKTVLLFTVFLLPKNTHCQTPSWQWAHSGGSSNSDAIPGIAIDGNENSYVTGYFEGPTFQMDNITLFNNDSIGDDIFIAKYNATGNIIWAKRFGGSGYDVGMGITVSPDGSIYAGGYFSSDTVAFDSFSLINNSGSTNVFIVKLDTSGNVIWCKNATGGGNANSCSDIAATHSGNVVMTGNFNGSAITFDSFVLNNSDTNGITTDLFITEYDSSGQVLFAKSSGGARNDEAYDITVDGNNYVYITGDFRSPAISFDSITLMNSTGIVYYSDFFLAKLDPSGNVIWAKNAQGKRDDFGKGVTTDINNNLYVVGEFSGDSLVIDTTVLINSSSYPFRDIFILKYNSTGNLIWAKRGGGPMEQLAYAIAVDQNFNSYVTGFYIGTFASFDTIVLTNGTSTYDIYLVKYDAAGNALWAKDLAISQQGQAECVETSVNGNVYVAGVFFTPTVTFDSTTLFNTTPNLFMDDIFIAKIGNAMTMIPELFPPITLSIFPNPALSDLEVMFNFEQNSYIKIEITNLVGQGSTILFEGEISPGITKKKFSIAELAAGAYFVKLTSKQQSVVKRIIKLN